MQHFYKFLLSNNRIISKIWIVLKLVLEIIHALYSLPGVPRLCCYYVERSSVAC